MAVCIMSIVRIVLCGSKYVSLIHLVKAHKEKKLINLKYTVYVFIVHKLKLTVIT